jgi:hypothetical protein
MYHLPYEHFDKLYGLLLYFNAVWFQKFEIALWNHYDTVGPRTNNHVEGFHSKLNRLCQEAHPNIFKSIGIVKDIETETAINYKQLAIGCHSTKRNRIDTMRDINIDTLKRQLFYNQID